MLRNYLAAAVRNLIRNRLYAAICIVGLAVGMAAAIVAGLYVRDELTFDHFVRGHEDVYVVVSDLQIPGRAPMTADVAPAQVASFLKSDFAEVSGAARLIQQPVGLRNGDVSALETVGWVDPDFFSVLRMPAVAGDPAATVHRPDGVVITRAMARKYFGQDAPVGRTLELNRAVRLRVGAVIEDLPSNTHLQQEIFVSGLNATAPQKGIDARPLMRGGFTVVGRTYARIDGPQAAARVNAAMPAFFTRHFAPADGKLFGGLKASLTLVPLDRLHLYPLGGTSIVNTSGQTSPAVLAALGTMAGLILVVAGINFVNLMTARAARRAVEVGVRKAAGAQRRDLVVQFVGEALIYALVAFVLAMAVVAAALPHLRAALDRPLVFAPWREPAFFLAALATSLLVGILAGVYPALVQSSFRPATVLKGGLPQTSGSAAVRAGLATLQFAVLIGLIFSVIVITRQTRFAMNEGLRVDKAEMLMVDVAPPPNFAAPPGPPRPLCRDAFADQVRALPGVEGAACSSSLALDMGDREMSVDLPGGARQGLGLAFADSGFFELYGLRPLAGRFFQRDHPADETPSDGPAPFAPRTAVINESAARALGYGAPAQAVGRSFRTSFGSMKADVRIIGVSPDFAFDLVHGGVRPMVYGLFTPNLDLLNVKLRGRDIPETTAAIERLWERTGSPRPPRLRFVDDYLQSIYVGVSRQGLLVNGLCGVAVFIACLGLLGLAAFTAERRTKEIGVRKAMGASTRDVLRLLLWRFTQPVLWANLIAWPAAWWAMHRWLEGFARRIELQPWVFLAASLAALLIAWITVFGQTLQVAAARPVRALRYE